MIEQKPKKSNSLSIVFALILGILATSLVFQNNKNIEINLWFWQVKSSFVLILGLVFFLGMLIALLSMSGRLLRKKRELKKCRKEIQRLQDTLKELSKKDGEAEKKVSTD